MTPPAIDHGDVQGLVRYGYAHMTEARFFLLRVADPGAARAWLRAAPVTTAARTGPGPRTALQVAFTREGLEALGVPAPVLAGILRRVRLGHGGRGEPLPPAGGRRRQQPVRLAVGWARQGSPCAGPALRRAGLLEPWTRAVTRDPWHAAFQVLPAPPPAPLDGVEPFGFVDGISQPVLDWERSRTVGERDVLEYGNVLSLGEVPARLPERVREVHRPPADRPAGRSRGESAARRGRSRAGAIWAATGATSSSASCARTFRASGSSCSARRTAIRRPGASWPRRWWGGR